MPPKEACALDQRPCQHRWNMKETMLHADAQVQHRAPSIRLWVCSRASLAMGAPSMCLTTPVRPKVYGRASLAMGTPSACQHCTHQAKSMAEHPWQWECAAPVRPRVHNRVPLTTREATEPGSVTASPPAVPECPSHCSDGRRHAERPEGT